MKVEIWSDIACPFCYIGKRKFELALEQFEQKEEVEVVYKSFQLDPNAPQNTKETMNEMLAKKYGQSLTQIEQMQKQITAQANEVGLDFHLNDAKMTNTFDAHRLVHFAKEKGKMKEMKEQLLKSYFIEGAHVGEKDSLIAMAESIGLDKEETATVLASEQFKKEVEADMQEGVQLGVQGVPFFVFNRKYAVSGAQPPKVFSEVLTKVSAEEKQTQPLNVIKQGDACTDDSC